MTVKQTRKNCKNHKLSSSLHRISYIIILNYHYIDLRNALKIIKNMDMEDNFQIGWFIRKKWDQGNSLALHASSQECIKAPREMLHLQMQFAVWNTESGQEWRVLDSRPYPSTVFKKMWDACLLLKIDFQLLNFDICVVWWCRCGSIHSQKSKVLTVLRSLSRYLWLKINIE